MASFESGTKVAGGYYWHKGAWEIVNIPQPGGTLPGTGATYLKLPFLVLLTVAPIMGAVFVMFLPFIGFALTIGVLLRKLGIVAKNAGVGLAGTVEPGWRPGEAYFAGKREAKDADAQKPHAKDGLEPLAAEIDEKRGEKK